MMGTMGFGQQKPQPDGERICRAVGTPWGYRRGCGCRGLCRRRSACGKRWGRSHRQCGSPAVDAVAHLEHTGIHVERDGVKVVTVFLSREISWGDIDRFAVRAREAEDGWRAP